VYNILMDSAKITPLIMFLVGLLVFITPQSLPRRFVREWTDGYAFAFWTAKVLSLGLLTLGIIGLFLAK
jgi:hypothetical protein